MSKTFTYEEALADSLAYFGGDQLPAKTFLDKYALRDKNRELLESNPDMMHRRLAKEFARIEKNKFKEPMSEDTIYEYFKYFGKIIPQGSPMFGIGNPNVYVSLSNCFVIAPPTDSYGGIFKTDQELVQLMKRRGGVGTCLSELRPEGFSVSNSAGNSTGAVSFAHRYSNSTREVAQDGRRGALMLTLDVHHPDIIKFCKVKTDNKSVTGANLSTKLSDEFLKAVDEHKEYEQRWPCNSKTPKFSRLVKAQEVWDTIIDCAWTRAEPGLLFWDLILRESPSSCYELLKPVGVNPCSEITEGANDSCRLLLLNLYKYVLNPFTSEAFFDYAEFYKDAQIAQRLADDLIDLEVECVDRIIDKVKSDPEDEETKKVELNLWEKVRAIALAGRRTGTGVTAVGGALAACGVKYGSEEGIKMVGKIYQVLKFGCYRSSIDMAKELGAFPLWDKDAENDCDFLNRIKDEVIDIYNALKPLFGKDLYKDMQKYGRRNVALLTTAPTGTVSMMAEVEHPIHGTESGIEPAIFISCIRRRKVNPSDKNARTDFVDQNGDCWQEYDVYHPPVLLWQQVTGQTDIKESPWFEQTAEQIDWTLRVKLQAAAQKHVDHAISSTINLPEDVTREEVANIYLTSWKSGCKGMTVYRKNCRTGVIIEKDSKTKIKKSEAPKRPDMLPCDIYRTVVDHTEYFVIVGLMEGEPYEVFAGKNIDVDAEDNLTRRIPTKAKIGLVKKAKRGHYQLVVDNEVVCDNIADHISDTDEAIARLVSTSLRHGSDISFVVDQLEKTKGSMKNFAKCISRVIKKYIKDGTKVSGETCPNCNMNNIVRAEGCKTCVQCGWTACG